VEPHKDRHQRMLVIAIVLLALLGVVVVVLDWGQVRQVLGWADWRLVPVALLFSAVSYCCLSYSFAMASRIFGVRMGRRDLFELGFVSYALNYLVASGGTAGYSLRILLIKRRGLPVRDVLAASLFHSILNNLLLFILVPVGFAYLLANRSLSGNTAVGVGVVTALLLLLVLLVAAVFFVGTFRAAVLGAVGVGWRKATRRNIEPQLKDLDSTLARGIVAIRDQPTILVSPLVLVVADWASAVTALWFCFEALGSPVGPGVLLTGFSIGVVAGLLSMIPGGLGVQEGSMAAVYALLGVPFGQAVLVAILFRAVYYLAPFLASLGFYWRLMRRKGKTDQRLDVL
jgi:glycosyltransferase 2 family protein